MIVVYDLETLRDFFLYVDIDIKTEQFNVFEISRFKNDLPLLLDHLKKIRGQIGFNNLGFDSQIQEYIWRNRSKFKSLSGSDLATIIAERSDYTVDKSNNGDLPEYWERDLLIKQVDLFRIWHFNNKGKMTGLKWLQYMMDWENIEDMPLNHLDVVDTREKADMIISYCKNDCLSTKRFYDITRGHTELKNYKGIDRCQLRKDIKADFLFDCTNFDDVKIGDEVNKQNYVKATGISRGELKEMHCDIKLFRFKDCFPPYINFITKELNNFISSIKDTPVKLDQKQEFVLKFAGTTYVIAKGGIHSTDQPRILEPRTDQILMDADIGSQYPNSIRKRKIYPAHLGEAWLEGYTDLINRRLEAKKKFKETQDPKYKSIDEALKYSLNGGSFGKFGEKTSWQYDPFASCRTTIGNQMEILMLIERLTLGGINVMSANTDGVVCLFDSRKLNKYYEICKEWEGLVGNNELGKLEFTEYKVLVQRSVNDYLAIKMNGDLKHKGSSFTVHHELHRNKSYRIINLALEAFYSKGLNPRTFITEHENIFDFCAGIRTKGVWSLEAVYLENNKMVREPLQKTNRYFISNNGVKLVKCNPDGREIQEDSGRWKASIYNKHVPKSIKDYDINYDFYVKKTYEIISEIQPEISGEGSEQLSMF